MVYSTGWVVAESLPVDDNWARVVWSLSTVHHWADVDAGLTESCRVLEPGGRLVALERRIHDTAADGVASHGWTAQQAESFAARCSDHGLLDVTVLEHPARTIILSVVAHVADTNQTR